MADTVKTLVEVRREDWGKFKAIAARQEDTVQGLLGHLVTREVRRVERAEAQRLGRTKAAKQALEKARVEFGA